MEASFAELKQEQLGTEKRRSLYSGIEGTHFSERDTECSDGFKTPERPRMEDPQDK